MVALVQNPPNEPEKPPSSADLHRRLAEFVARLKMTHDPMAEMFELLWMILGRIEVAAAQPPIPKEVVRDMAAAASRGAAQNVWKLARAHNLRTILISSGILTAAILGSGVVGYAAAGGFIATCQEQGGGRVCFFWTSPPTAAKVAAQ